MMSQIQSISTLRYRSLFVAFVFSWIIRDAAAQPISKRFSYNSDTLFEFCETQNAVRLFQKVNDKRGECLCIKEIGVLHYLANESEEALTQYTRALVLAKESNLTRAIIAINNNIGNLFDRQEHYDEAIS